MPKVCVEFDPDNGGPQSGVKTYTTVVGDGSQLDFPVDHNLGVQGVFVTAYNVTTGLVVQDYELTLNTVNRLTVRFDVAPAPQSVRVMVLAPVTAP